MRVRCIAGLRGLLVSGALLFAGCRPGDAALHDDEGASFRDDEQALGAFPEVPEELDPPCQAAREGGNHAWPGGWPYLGEAIIGRTPRDDSATEVVWRFFAAHSAARS